MDLMKMGMDLLGDKLGDAGGIMEALGGLTGGDGLDLGGIADKLKQGGLGDQVDSWMGDGENLPVSADQVKEAVGEDKLSEMAGKLGVDSDGAADKLSQMLPSVMDKASSGGNLLEQFTSGNPLDIAKGLFGK